MEEYTEEYMDNGIRNWLKIQQDVAFIKKNFKPGTVPSREVGKSIIEQKYQDPLELLDDQRSSVRKRQHTCSPMESKLASYGIQFLDTKSRRTSVSLLAPNSGEEEEQVKMATKLSLSEPRMKRTVTPTQTNTTNSCEEASVLLSLSGKQSED